MDIYNEIATLQKRLAELEKQKLEIEKQEQVEKDQDPNLLKLNEFKHKKQEEADEWKARLNGYIRNNETRIELAHRAYTDGEMVSFIEIVYESLCIINDRLKNLENI